MLIIRSKMLPFIGIIFGWSILIGLMFYFSHISVGSPIGIILIALLYMPSPAIATIILN